MFHTADKADFTGRFEDRPLVRAELAVVKTLVWGGFLASAVIAAAFDIGRLFNFW